MPMQIQINIQADDSGQFTPVESLILRALAQDGTMRENTPEAVAAAVAASTITEAELPARVPSVTDDQQKLLDAVTVPKEDAANDAEPEPEKPKRKRRTKAEIEAERQAEEEAKGSTGPAVLEDTDDKVDADAREAHDAAAEAEANAIEQAKAAGYPGADEIDDEPATTPKQAFEIATKLVGLGKMAEVKEALDVIGVARASHIKTAEEASGFVDALDAGILALI